MMEMQLIMAAFIQRYDFELVKDQKVVTKPLVTLRPKNGVFLTMKLLIKFTFSLKFISSVLTLKETTEKNLKI